jgi:hypothetical protein
VQGLSAPEDSSLQRPSHDSVIAKGKAAMDSKAIAQWAHDIRNTLGTVALYLEALEPQADPRTCSVSCSI